MQQHAAYPPHGPPPPYGAPAQPGYGAPPAYGAPAQPGYGAPPAYGAPAQPGYGAPPAYGAAGGPPPPPPAFGVAPAQPGYQPVQHVNTVVVAPSGVVRGGMRFGEYPVPMTCHYCSASVVTGTTKKSGSFVWMMAGGICLVGALFLGITWCGCCLIPLCIDSMKDTDHHCPNCNRLLGTHCKTL